MPSWVIQTLPSRGETSIQASKQKNHMTQNRQANSTNPRKFSQAQSTSINDLQQSEKTFFTEHWEERSHATD